jgi:hypothetical protein
MPTRKPALVLLACLLTLAASGDDFCFPRLVCPATTAPSGVLPLDDPSTDFVAPAARQARGRARGLSPLRVAIVPLLALLALTAACTTDVAWKPFLESYIYLVNNSGQKTFWACREIVRALGGF